MYTKKLWRRFVIGLFLVTSSNNVYGMSDTAWFRAYIIARLASQVTMICLEQAHKWYFIDPIVMLPNANTGTIDRWKRWWNNYESPSMIFPQEVQDKLEEIVKKTEIVCKYNQAGKKIRYDNLILYGCPGTGKTLFAQVLADKADMDFAPITAGSLLQKGAGVNCFNNLIAGANKSSRGVLIFIDEADSLFVNRDTIKQDSAQNRILTHLLAHLGQGSNKFMIVVATNSNQGFDPAVVRRFQDCVYMPLPNAQTREKVIRFYVNSVLLNKKNNDKSFVDNAQKEVTDSMIDDMVQKTDGFSSAEIKDAIDVMHKKAIISEEKMINKKHISNALEEALKKKKDLERVKVSD